ncbi:hybrid sensor histidine kinase/response regulator [Methylorubrum rhodesianum]|jgi:two-component system chemotaxis sensor kinase CheA|uniref:histidine kinase n=1 Tax=Methylorubrum rhodesianum TaxID=29427 RepID=A0ABU9Z9Y4_9HYPH|nr:MULTISPECIES: hybrid sensor histidine kinase/response regulator [Methylorubrum]MBB5763115.1 two-component system chemotaxis sensor kinase CheA [Methylorubrum rhodesianum]MBI1689156.1 hybrid sensor histidine kinase/response regulator [Methylorubrum sp. DB1722]MBK3403388.1 hybrid sensor histidine kinase/response regulator [Methylorubrum rhodesianum]MBY0139746.1 hybrid sensor histidine kinase/response regulator [Methylorubrum populi]
MDDLLREFLVESAEHLDTVDAELVRFEQDPNNQQILRNIFRLVHTIKGTCGFLGLPRLEALAHAAETLMGRFRDGYPVSGASVTLILATLDRLKAILADLEATGSEPAGADADLIGALEQMASEEAPAAAAPPPPPELPPIVERELKPGEVSLEDLERAFMEAPGPDDFPAAPAIEAPAPVLEAPAPTFESAPEPAAPVQAAERPAAAPSAPAAEGGESAVAAKVQTIRVNVDTIEHLMTMVSELVLTRNQLLEIARRHEDSGYKVPLQRLSHVTAELQEGVMKTRMQPIGNAWQKLPRVVRDLSAELGKGIDLVMSGAETELDRQVLDVIKDPLTHMVRNSADHGIEATNERLKAGKPARGTIRLSAYHEGGTITIEIADDGKGLDLAAIRKKAVERNLAPAADVERMTDAQVAKFIFHAGFSTAKAVTSVSGRGVGMDVVKTNIETIGGVVDIATELGRGTTFTIKIPLTLAIVSALIVKAGEQRYAVPQIAVLELVRVDPKGENKSTNSIERIHGAPVLRLRERLLPIVTLEGLMRGQATVEEGELVESGFVVVAQVGRQRFGVLVDEVFHTEEIVVKPMSSKLRHIPLFAGNTILGDGAVVLIVDPNGVAKLVGQSAQSGAATETEVEETEAGDAKATLLVFKGGAGGFKAVPLSLVTRLEEIDASKIEHLGGRPLIQYRGRLMPLVPADPGIEIRSEGNQALVVFSDGDRAMGLVVDEIVDIVEERLDIEISADRSDLIGSAVLRGRATDIINIAHFLPLAYDDWARGPRKTVVKAPSLLLVDDSAFFRDMLTPVLKAAGYGVTTAASADEAMGLLKGSAGIDLVVSDLDMPGRSGFDLVAAMRKSGGRLAEMPVIALTGTVAADAIEQARRLAISDLVAKFDRSGLLAALAEIGEAAEPAARAAA